jgi:hypothetical protein
MLSIEEVEGLETPTSQEGKIAMHVFGLIIAGILAFVALRMVVAGLSKSPARQARRAAWNAGDLDDAVLERIAKGVYVSGTYERVRAFEQLAAIVSRERARSAAQEEQITALQARLAALEQHGGR